MTEEKLRDIKSRYPNITTEELLELPEEEFNKCSISLLESLVKDYKDQLQNFFKNHKSWDISEENIEWYKDFMRDGKNRADTMLKERVKDQEHLRGGLNPPFCYENRIKKGI